VRDGTHRHNLGRLAARRAQNDVVLQFRERQLAKLGDFSSRHGVVLCLSSVLPRNRNPNENNFDDFIDIL
jgi:hypothetical protein